MSIWTDISKKTTSWTASDKETTSWTEQDKKDTSWTVQSKETTAFRTLNTFKEIVFDSSYEDSLGFIEIALDNAIDDIFNIKTLNLSRSIWTTV